MGFTGGDKASDGKASDGKTLEANASIEEDVKSNFMKLERKLNLLYLYLPSLYLLHYSLTLTGNVTNLTSGLVY
jgi:hypothetical protein